MITRLSWARANRRSHFDTLYAEGQRRYVESLSAYARQFLQLMEKPDVDLIEGLSPAISIEQKATSHNPRSTVGTVTEIHDYLRLLYARAGTPHCPEHGIVLAAQSVAQMVDHVLQLPRRRTRLMIVSPLVVGRKGEQADLFDGLRAQGFVRVRIDGTVHEIDALPKLKKNSKHTVRPGGRSTVSLGMRGEIKQRLAESFETALRHSDGRALAVEMDSGKEHLFSRPNSPARCAAIRCPNSNRACFRSTIRWAPARAATAWARSTSSIPGASLRTPHLSLASGAHVRGWDHRNQFYFQMLKSLGAAITASNSIRAYEQLPAAIAGSRAATARARKKFLSTTSTTAAARWCANTCSKA